MSHLNLHKTFCIPHGGGGPGVGPVAVRAHLAPHLPSHDAHPEAEKRSGIGAISAAPYGLGRDPADHLGLHPDDGAEGLTRATAVGGALGQLRRPPLQEHSPCSTAGTATSSPHECILDLRAITKASGVTVDDVAKRLVDHGFHAPTMSFPVAGTLMVEPTESEDLAEIRPVLRRDDRHPRGDRARRGGGSGARGLAAAARAHTARALVGEWDSPYSREVAVFPRAASTPTSTGRRSHASTRPTATATWSARAPRRRRSRKD